MLAEIKGEGNGAGQGNAKDEGSPNTATHLAVCWWVVGVPGLPPMGKDTARFRVCRPSPEHEEAAVRELRHGAHHQNLLCRRRAPYLVQDVCGILPEPAGSTSGALCRATWTSRGWSPPTQQHDEADAPSQGQTDGMHTRYVADHRGADLHASGI